MDQDKKEINNKEKIKVDSKVIIRAGLFVFLYIILCISLNCFYFSQNKISRLPESGEMSVLVPSDTPIYQSFYVPYKSVSGLYLYIENSKEYSDAISIVLLDDNSNSLRHWDIKSEQVISHNPFFLSLDGLSINEDTLYTLLAVSDGSSPMGIIAYGDSDFGYGSSMSEGYIWGYQIEYNTFDIKIILIEVLFLLMCVFVYVGFKKKYKTDNILCIIYLVFAFIFFFITPFNTLFDEDGHFIRCYEIAQGSLLSAHYDNGMGKTVIPDSLIKGVSNVTKSLDSNGAEFIYARQKDLINYNFYDDYIDLDNPNQALYSPFTYIPQVIGLSIGNLVTQNVYVYYMFGRIFALLINSLLVLFAIKLCPEKKYLIFVLASTPVFLSQMISYSADGNVNSIAVFFVAFIFNRINKEQIKVSDEIIVTVGAVILALSKVIYFPFALLVLLFDNSSFKSRKRAVVYKIITISIAVICFSVWFLIARTYLFDNQNGRDIHPKLQMIYMITHFYKMPIVFVETVYNGFLGWIGQISGGVLGKGWLQYSSIIWFGFMILIYGEFSCYKVEKKYNGIITKSKTKRILLIMIIMVILLTFTSLYTQWTVYRADMVDGIQGRYFIPLILPISYLFIKKTKNQIENKNTTSNDILILEDELYKVMGVIILSLCSILCTLKVYY